MSKANSFRADQHVKWPWGSGTGEGRVKERFEREVRRMIAGSTIKRNGSVDDSADLIEQEDGGQVLKLGSELEGT